MRYRKAYVLLTLCVLCGILVSCSFNQLTYPDEITTQGFGYPQTDIANPNIYNNPIHNTAFEAQALCQYFLLGGILARFNVTTGEVTYLCDDPLCPHGADCLFSDVGLYFTVDEQKHVIYYVSDHNLMKYDIARKKAEILYTIASGSDTERKGGAMTALAFDYYWYRDAYAEVFFRVNLETGVYEQLDSAYDIPAAYIDGRYYCAASGSPTTEVYSLSADMTDKQTILRDCILYYVNFDHVSSQDSGYITFAEWCDGELVRYAYDLATKQKNENANAQRSGEIWDNYVCYTKAADNPRLMGECGLNGKIYNRSGGTVYRYNTETGTEERLFANDDLVIGMPQVVGGYLVYDFGAFVIHDTFNCPFWQADAGGKLVIDIETGNYCVYYNTWDKTLSRYT